MNKITFILIFLLSATVLAQNSTFNIKDFNASGDGTTLDTKAIQNTIDACYTSGGGTVVIPAGTWLTGCIVLKSNINLHLEPGALLLGSPNKDDYKIIVPDFESRTNDLYVNRSIIYAEKAENVSLTGTGIINGNGRHKNFSVTHPQNNRPFLARFVNCTNVTIRDVSMIESANWTCHLLGCKDVLVDGLKIKNSIRANRDGLDIDGCENITVSNCRIYSMDDAIVFKSTGPAIVKNALVTNCIVSSHASGIKFGTETTGGYENVAISNCVIKNIPVYSGIAMMIVDGGAMRNISVNNIVMDSVNIPFMVRLGNRARPYKNEIPTPDPGYIGNISINNITATNAGLPSHITGLQYRRINNVILDNINITYNKEYTGKPLPYNKVPFKEADYPSGQLYGTNLPASALYIRNVNMLNIKDVNISFLKEDRREAFVFDNVTDVEMINVRVKKSSATPNIYMRNVNNAFISNCTNTIKKNIPVAITEKNCKKIKIYSRDIEEYLKSVPSLADITFEDIKGYSEHSFAGKMIKGLDCLQLNKGGKTIELKAVKGKIFKLQFLSRTDSPSVVSIEENGKSYHLTINNSEWGWNVLNIHEVCENSKVILKIKGKNNSSVCLAKVILIPQSVTD